jgi:hypothetical protein
VAGTLLLATAVALVTGSALVSAGAADTAHLLGTVSGGGSALPGIEAVAYLLDGDGTWDLAGFDKTDGLGQYDVGALAAGTYHVRFVDSTGAYLGEYLDDAATVGAGQDVAVAEGESVTIAGVELAPAAHIAGTVTGGGTPLARIGVSAYQFLSDPAFHDYWSPVASGRTDAAGHYDRAGRPAGTYRLGFTDFSDAFVDEYWDDAGTLERSQEVAVAPGGTAAGKDALLAAVSHIQGTVSGPDGPLAGVEVQGLELQDGAWRLAAQATTDALGGYDLAGLREGTFRVAFEDWADSRAREFFAGAPRLAGAQDVPVGASETVTGIDALLASGHIRGTITDTAGDAVDGLALAYGQEGAGWEVVGAATTDVDGNYDIAGLPAGTYRVQLSDFGVQAEDGAAGVAPLSEWWKDEATLEAADDVVLAGGGSRTGIDGTLVLGEHVPVPTVTNTVLPAISGSPQVGKTLTASTGSWDPSVEITHTYQWFANGTPIVDATAATYNPTADMVGRRIAVRVTASVIGRWPGSATSLETAPVVAASAPAPPGTEPTQPARVVANAVLPRIVGKARVGQRLRLTSGSWTPTVVTRKLQWLANGKAVKRATRTFYVVRAGQVGKRLTVRVVASATGYQPVTVTTRPTARVRP